MFIVFPVFRARPGSSSVAMVAASFLVFVPLLFSVPFSVPVSAAAPASFVVLVAVLSALSVSASCFFAVALLHLGNDMWQMWLLAKEVKFIELFSEHNKWSSSFSMVQKHATKYYSAKLRKFSSVTHFIKNVELPLWSFVSLIHLVLSSVKA